MNLENVDLLELQTSYMKNDPTTIAMCKALSPQFRKLANETKACLIYSRIDDLDEVALDELAWQMHVDFYTSDLNIDIKRKLIKESLLYHRKKGTPDIVERMATTVFGRSKLKEWFEYGGSPYYFKMEVEITNQGASEYQLKLLDNLINAYKNKRSWLEKIEIFLASIGTFFIAFASVFSEEVTVYPWSISSIDVFAKLNISTGVNSLVETSTVYPKI
ncbi:phage tail protein I [Clostridium cylindrosporum]|uniref:Phage tail protein, P2 protein I family n=1 Tax=Clostridium cylindrosporum DSM 605 TaxID=1121307 RepID=A0A0J8DB16_CLOCY|nr:phage tail protein I [Clostridium cylindrosporum]KMT23017.1 phage tail protein, P2 protein I family [Clostridium cylindrosporum DSM 605]